MRKLKLSYAEAEQLYLRMVFNVLARNCDDHTKNFAFLMDKNGKWSLSPAYDICHAYRPDSEWVSQHNLSINGKRRHINQDDLLSLAKLYQIRKPEHIIKWVSSIINNWCNYAEEFKVDKKLTQAIDATLIKT